MIKLKPGKGYCISMPKPNLRDISTRACSGDAEQWLPTYRRAQFSTILTGNHSCYWMVNEQDWRDMKDML